MKIRDKLKSLGAEGLRSNIAAVVLLSFTVLIFAPFEIYLSNKEYFFFGGDEMIEFSLLFFLFACGVLTAVSAAFGLINSRIMKVITALIWSLALALYIQGNYIRADYGALDGRSIDWSQYKTEGIISVGVFAVVMILGTLVCLKLKSETAAKLITVSSVCIVLVQIVTISTLLLTHNGLKRPYDYISTTKDEFVFSKDENFIILLLDTFDSQAFDEILKDENAADYKEILSDFTYYPDTCSIYPGTDLSMPSILSGEMYYNEDTYGDYLARAYANSPLLKGLEADGWACGFYTTVLMANNDDSLKFDNCMKVRTTVSSHRTLAKFMYRFVGYRYLIQPLKKYCWFYPEEMRSYLKDTGIHGIDAFDESNFKFYDGIDALETTDAADKCFRWYHLSGTHPPFSITADFEGTGEDSYELEGIYEEARAMMKLMDKFFGRLKEEGVYDNSTIIVMADHGYMGLSQSPIFMVKGRSDSHPFAVNDGIEVSYADLQDIFVRILSGADTADEIVDIPGGMRDRTFMYYKWASDFNYDSYARPLTEYVISGDCRDMTSLNETGKVYEHKE